jgi:hypothetical protein
MPDRRAHRGLHPNDAELFGAAWSARLRAATLDLSWLLERGYAVNSALKLTGDRYALTARQRAAVSRCACPESRARDRIQRMLPASALAGATLCIDGFNVLTTLEVALSGGLVMIGRDGVMRDIAGVHGSYRRVEETEPALLHLRRTLDELGVARCEWLLDAPVSNSGRLCALLRELAAAEGLDWDARAVADPDVILAASVEPIASADGEVLDSAARSCNLARLCVERTMPAAFVLDLSGESQPL